jgi:hypothetical protein
MVIRAPQSAGTTIGDFGKQDKIRLVIHDYD